MEGAILFDLVRSAKILGLSTLALGAIWIVVAIGASQSITALGLWRPDSTATLECGRQLNPQDESSRVIPAIRAQVVLDDAWAELDPDSQAVRSLVVEASGLLRGTGLSVTPVEIKRWNLPESLRSPREILDAAEARLPPGDADIVIILIADSTTPKDGAADIGGRHVAIRHHRDAPENDAVVLAHELGHLLGAHHGCDSDLGGGIMGATGFANAELLCPCTRRAIEDNIPRFRESTRDTP